MLNEQIYAFAAGLEDADTSPTKQELETYAKFHDDLQTQLGAWDALKKNDLAAFHAEAQKA
jgi:hypothetical protein